MEQETITNRSLGVTIKELTKLINGGNAHATFDEAVKGIPFSLLGKRVEKLPYTIWQLADHIRITQWDILEFSRDPDHESPSWPDEYWPEENQPSDESKWVNCINQIRENRQEFIDLLDQRANELLEPFPYGTGQNLLREAMLIADHTSYHTGQIILIRRLLGDWV